MNQKSLDKKKANNSLSDVRNKAVKPNKTKELDWRDKIDWVDDWLEIDCQVIFGEKGKKTLIKFIEYLLTQQRSELLEEILEQNKDDMTGLYDYDGIAETVISLLNNKDE